MAVICTREATRAPMSRPGINAASRIGHPAGFIAAAVATSAITIPTMPYQFPRRAVSCFDRPPRLKINKALAAMYAMVIRLVCIQYREDVRNDCQFIWPPRKGSGPTSLFRLYQMSDQ